MLENEKNKKIDTISGKKNKGGRPSKKGTISLSQLRKLAEFGLIEEQIVAILGISRETLSQYKTEGGKYYWPEFSDTIKRGKAKSDANVEKSLYQRAVGYEHPEDKIFCSARGKVTTVRTIKHYPPDPVSCIFWLKNRRKAEWRDRQEIDLTMKEFKHAELKHETAADLKADAERLADQIIKNRGRTCISKKGKSS